MLCHMSSNSTKCSLIGQKPTKFRAKAHHVTPWAKARLPIGLTGVHLNLIAMLSRNSISDNNQQACLFTSSLSLFCFQNKRI